MINASRVRPKDKKGATPFAAGAEKSEMSKDGARYLFLNCYCSIICLADYYYYYYYYYYYD